MHQEEMTKKIEEVSEDMFDKVFLDMMIMHHEGAVDMAKVVQRRSKNDKIKEFANKIIETQQNEIRQMEQWKSEV